MREKVISFRKDEWGSSSGDDLNLFEIQKCAW